MHVTAVELLIALCDVVHASDESIVHIAVCTNQRRRNMMSSAPMRLSVFSYVRGHTF